MSSCARIVSEQDEEWAAEWVAERDEEQDAEYDLPQVVELSIDGTSGNVDFERHFAETLRELFELGKRKQASYGPHNIGDFGDPGVVVRVNDKLQRLRRLVWDRRADPIHDETIVDTWLDLANYGIFGAMLSRGQWPGRQSK